MWSRCLTTIALFGSAFASPFKRGGSGCAGLINSLADVADFTLSAVYNNDTSLVRPLGLVAMTPSLFNSFIVVLDPPTEFTMTNSGIETTSSSPTVSQSVGANGFLEFVSHTTFPPSEVYCELFNTDPNGSPFPGPVLAVNGDADNFSICPAGLGNKQDAVVYKATSACDAVHIVVQSST